ncbi:PCI domain protein [Onchocerca flexuosa]|uniref:Eukaryotic translation initiation factor 3 subunit M n=2 Tax=Onchocerca flexuosa TaxID=387005 RepID=A0A238C3D6_9BILA|nr:PCI domain protein [Onchocerca flexuosa]
MADTKALPVFAFTDDRIQLQQLRAYMREHGSSINEEGPADFSENLEELVKTVAVLGSLESEKEVEMILNSISSLIVVLTPEAAEKIINEFCKQLSSESFKGTGWNSNASSAVRTLSNLFFAFNKHPRVQHALYLALVALCGRARIIGDLDTSTEKVNEYINRWSLDQKQQRSLLRLIHWALIHDGRADQAAKTMTALLRTYTDADAVSAIEDARECVRTAIVDPKSFSFDHLLRLSAVQLLEKSDPLMHEVLKLFSQGTLKDYRTFVTKHPTFISEKLHVDDTVLIKKMRLLTLMDMAEKKTTISLHDLSLEVDIPENEELEEFIIEAIRINAISGKINELKKELNVTSLQHRSFGRPQWELLRKRLIALISSLSTSHENIKNVYANGDTT